MKKYGKHGDYNRITFEKDLEMLLEEKKPDVILQHPNMICMEIIQDCITLYAKFWIY